MTGAACDCFWRIDPLPVPPNVPRDSMTYWRWHSALLLELRGLT